MKSLSVKQKLIMSVAAVILILITPFAIINYQLSGNREISSVENEITQAGEDLSKYIGEWIDTKLGVLAAASEFSEEWDVHDRLLEQARMAGRYLYLYFGTTDGQMIMQPQETLPDDYDPRTRPWYQQAMASNQPIITEPYVDASSGDLVISFAQQTAIGVIAGDIKMTEIVEEVLSVDLGNSGLAMLTNPSGKVIIHPDEAFIDQNLNDFVLDGALTNEVTSLKIDGTTVLGASFDIPGSDWNIVVTVDRDEALASLSGIAVRSFLLTLAIVVIVSLVLAIVITALLKPLDALQVALEDISAGDGDLTQRLEVKSDDEIGRLSKAFNNFIESIHHLIIDVIDSATQLEELAKQSNHTAGENSSAIQNQQDEISQVAAAIHEMSSTSSTVADNAKVTADSAEKALSETSTSESNANENRDRMHNLTDQIEDTAKVITQLNEQAQQINTILATIQGIAEQTNLLALNAAIEAARAGEQGRGFAVVADEVRALSQRTHEATGEIQSMIETLGGQTSSAVTQTEKSKDLVEQTMTTAAAVSSSQTLIKEAINDINAQAISIAEASREQNSATEEINRITQAIQEQSQQLASNVESAHSLSEQLHELGSKVQSHLSRFRT
jgi:methyl-accepting chemotaxis protein